MVLVVVKYRFTPTADKLLQLIEPSTGKSDMGIDFRACL
jgi:hypothetical protein